MKRLILLFFLVCQMALLFGQDFHFSNFKPAAVHFNPSQTATSDSDVRLGVQYRRQWSATMHPFTTMGATAELRGRNTGFGFQVYQNNAGEASLKTTGVMLSGAYHKTLARMSELSLGIAVGRLQKRFDPTAFTYDNQYVEGQGFNAALASGENFTRTSVASTDVAVGMHWRGGLTADQRIRGRGGFAFSHIHRPDQGFYGFVEEMPMKTVVQAGVDIRIGNQFDLSPDIFFQKQGEAREIVVGTSVDGQLDKNASIILGMAYRINDAIIGQVGFRHKNKSIYISYDANSSELKSATSGNGAWELGLYLTFDRTNKKELKDTDGDGIFDHRDDCPKVPGVAAFQGCPKEGIAAAEEFPDADRDGVPDDIDRCPLVPGLPCFYGCLDSDRDGLIDEEDSCPEIFGPVENNGCPVFGRDSDRDGIPDDEDYCIYLKGQKEFHGCPDSDRDGVSDVDDHCPYRKGTVEYNGCPMDMDPFVGDNSTIVEFETDKSDLIPAHKYALADFINKIPIGSNFRVIVSGHTDTEGTAYYNYELSQRRANQVMDFLVRRGIPYNRIETISYGEAIPRRSNDSENGKARNRRCEVRLVID